jgi:Lon protease-like protein
MGALRVIPSQAVIIPSMNSPLRIADLPTTIHLLPLGPFLLLPGASLPITLTDLWSRGILEAAQESGGWVGVIQPLEEGGFYTVGCLGHIVDLGRDEEGQRVVLEGMLRFRVRRELPPEGREGFPRAEVDYGEFAADLAAGLAEGAAGEAEPVGWDLEMIKEKIVDFGRRQFGTAGILESMSPRQVVLFMAQTAPFSAAEKQALLEAADLRELVDLLARLLSLNFMTTTPDTSPPSTVN